MYPARDHYVSGKLYEELGGVLKSVNHTFDEFAKDYICKLCKKVTLNALKASETS